MGYNGYVGVVMKRLRGWLRSCGVELAVMLGGLALLAVIGAVLYHPAQLYRLFDSWWVGLPVIAGLHTSYWVPLGILASLGIGCLITSLIHKLREKDQD